MSFGLTHDASLDQIVDGAMLEARFQQHLVTVLPDTGRRAQIILRKARNAGRPRGVYRPYTRRLLAHRRPRRLDMGITQPFAGIEDALRNEIGGMQSRQPDIRRL